MDFKRIFLDEGPQIQQLLQKDEIRRTAPDFVGGLLESFIPASPGRQAPPSPLLEPLSERELEVLRILPTNLTTPEIAGELVISVNTVRTHIKSIYSKMGVHSRSEAVKAAKERSLL